MCRPVRCAYHRRARRRGQRSSNGRGGQAPDRIAFDSRPSRGKVFFAGSRRSTTCRRPSRTPAAGVQLGRAQSNVASALGDARDVDTGVVQERFEPDSPLSDRRYLGRVPPYSSMADLQRAASAGKYLVSNDADGCRRDGAGANRPPRWFANSRRFSSRTLSPEGVGERGHGQRHDSEAQHRPPRLQW